MRDQFGIVINGRFENEGLNLEKMGDVFGLLDEGLNLKGYHDK